MQPCAILFILPFPPSIRPLRIKNEPGNNPALLHQQIPAYRRFRQLQRISALPTYHPTTTHPLTYHRHAYYPPTTPPAPHRHTTTASTTTPVRKTGWQTEEWGEGQPERCGEANRIMRGRATGPCGVKRRGPTENRGPLRSGPPGVIGGHSGHNGIRSPRLRLRSRSAPRRVLPGSRPRLPGSGRVPGPGSPA